MRQKTTGRLAARLSVHGLAIAGFTMAAIVAIPSASAQNAPISTSRSNIKRPSEMAGSGPKKELPGSGTTGTTANNIASGSSSPNGQSPNQPSAPKPAPGGNASQKSPTAETMSWPSKK